MSKSTRLLILRCCSLGILITLGIKLLVKSSTDEFPKNLAGNRWESIDIESSRDHSLIKEGKRYQEKILGNNLTTEIYYIPNNIVGNKRLIQEHQQLEYSVENITVFKKNNLGYYGLVTEDNQTYLNTCIHPEGKTAFTRSQFANLANQNLKSRFVPWLLGVSDLRDWRCFWVNMSLSLDNISEQEASEILQKQLLKLVSQVTK